MSKRPRFQIDDSHFSCVVKRPVAILMVTLAVGVFGWVSYQRLALTLMPNNELPHAHRAHGLSRHRPRRSRTSSRVRSSSSSGLPQNSSRSVPRRKPGCPT